MNKNVSIVIVSHSSDVARGAAEMARAMVGTDVEIAHCGGTPSGDLGTNVSAIMAAIESVWSDSGVAVLVDLGGAESNSEVAIEMLGRNKSERIVICSAPIVEGAVMAATEASCGTELNGVRRTAEEFQS